MITLKPANVDAYIKEFPQDVQTVLQQVRDTIRATAPEAKETIKYNMPTYELEGNLVHFAAFKHHIGFYSIPSGLAAFEKELSLYKTAKGSIQFPLQQQVPLHLIRLIVQFRVEENKAKAKKKKAARRCKNGHVYYKSSDCPVCPYCEEKNKPANGFLSLLAAPARRALEGKGLTNLEALSACSEKELLALHGLGKSAIMVLRKALTEKGLGFKI